MQVLVVVEFPDIEELNGDAASEMVDAVTLETVRMQQQWADKNVRVWVDDVTNEV